MLPTISQHIASRLLCYPECCAWLSVTAIQQQGEEPQPSSHGNLNVALWHLDLVVAYPGTNEEMLVTVYFNNSLMLRFDTVVSQARSGGYLEATRNYGSVCLPFPRYLSGLSKFSLARRESPPRRFDSRRGRLGYHSRGSVNMNQAIVSQDKIPYEIVPRLSGSLAKGHQVPVPDLVWSMLRLSWTAAVMPCRFLCRLRFQVGLAFACEM